MRNTPVIIFLFIRADVAKRKEFRDQLPRYEPWNIERWLAAAGAVGGIVALIISVFHLDRRGENIETLILLGEISALCVGLIVYLYVTARKKRHRFAQATIFVHYVSHIIRDEVAASEAGKPTDPQAILQDVVDAVATCFSILSARRARCCIKEIKAGLDVATVVRDNVTKTQSPPVAPTKSPDNIEANTDYKSIWYGANGCPRFFVSNNLVKLWRTNQYRNSSFEAYGEPVTGSFLGMTFVRKWTLPYKSTIVWPIRYVPEGAAWPALNQQSNGVDKTPFVWGFLCVDWSSRNSFDEIYSPELGAAFADAIFTLLHVLLSASRSPNSQPAAAKSE
ncbi:hypothetical protein ACQ86E_31685 [Bradyrhizobium betae]|uniref:hypothetical protein n=1 Tax=Bradyrhizobium betae TaxID=244734 RepID=UPI003D67E5FE